MAGLNIVFLDIDGVANNQLSGTRDYLIRKSAEKAGYERGGCSCQKYSPSAMMDIDKENILYLNRLFHRIPNLQIVLSSSWRVFHEMDEMNYLLGRNGFEFKLKGRTASLSGPRGNEIQDWMNKHREKFPGKINNILILDDDSDMVHLGYKHYKTNFHFGFEPWDIEPALKVLERPLEPEWWTKLTTPEEWEAIRAEWLEEYEKNRQKPLDDS